MSNNWKCKSLVIVILLKLHGFQQCLAQGTFPYQRIGRSQFQLDVHPVSAPPVEIQISDLSSELKELESDEAESKIGNPVNLYRFYNNVTMDHLYTTNYTELGGGSQGGYVYEGVIGLVYQDATTGTVPLYRYYNPTTHDHFYTTDFAELKGGNKDYVFESIQCYIYPQPTDGTEPVYRYYNSQTGKHFYTTNFSEMKGGGAGFVLEGIAGYIIIKPPS